MNLLESILKELDARDPVINAGYILPEQRTREVNDKDQEVKASIYKDGAVVVASEGLYVSDNDDRLKNGVFFFEFERALYGKDLFPWTQAIGDCVSFGAAGGSQDGLTIGHLLSGGLEVLVGETVATEPIYGGSRVEVGGGRLSGDGSLGSWAVKWLVSRAGVLLRQRYGDVDLGTYSGSRARSWGRTGCPDSIEDDAKLHPVTDAAQVKDGATLISMTCNLNPTTVASNMGFERTYRENAVCLPRGSWAHQMFVRGIAMGKDVRIYVFIQNSWGDYIRVGSGGSDTFTTYSGREVKLPKGCFATPLDEIERDMLARGDCWALRSPVGWQTKQLMGRIEKLLGMAA